MREIKRRRFNGVRVVSLFSGCGGSSLGYRMAGCKVVWANEFIPAARDSYRANFPQTTIDPRDIREITGAEIMQATGLEVGELDILDGSPPCASFSTAGKRSRDWGKVKAYSETKQRTDDLFLEYVRLVRELRPKRFIAENVAGLVKGVGKGWFLDIYGALQEAGYRVGAQLLDAQWLGVPQARQRLFFVGVRNDLDAAPAFPKPLPYRYSVRDALPWITATGGIRSTGFGGDQLQPSSLPAQTIMAGGGHGMNTSQFGVVATIEHANGWNGHAPQSIEKPALTIQADRPVAVMTKRGPRSAEKPAPTVMTHNRRYTHGELSLTVEPEADMTGYAVGDELRKLAPGAQSDRYFQLVRAPLNGPSPTITVEGKKAHAASVAHPIERRKFSIAELRRICGFPDDFVLTGTYQQQWERLGRAVPPPMMAALVAANIAIDARPARTGRSRAKPVPATTIAAALVPPASAPPEPAAA
jgi:DNA (cytosine-5)-methyltransferase 1